jgi:ABC-type transporter Mla subunit MlaD
MRRLALILALLAAAGGTALVGAAGADDTYSYEVELDNAFGLVQGTDVRIAGVQAGSVTDLDVNAAKRAVVTIEVSGPLARLREDATCSSEPQSLIAEYFLDCQPGQSERFLPEEGLIPVEQTTTTVQSDLVFNTLREPYKERLALIISSFGTGLAGNPENLNEAVLRGAPALKALRSALSILADQNRTIRDLNVNGDTIIARLAERRDDVVRFVQTVGDAAEAAADRREDLAADFRLLPGFLAELQPSLSRLGDLAEEGTPFLEDLDATSGQLTRFSRELPRFNNAAAPAIQTLGDAADVGRRALRRGGDEIKALKQASRKAFAAADPTAEFLTSIDDPSRYTEVDPRAARDTGRSAPTGYTGMESLLNWAYYLTTASNQFDPVGHLTQFTLDEVGTNPCTAFNAGYFPNLQTGEWVKGVPNKGSVGPYGSAGGPYGLGPNGYPTTDASQIHECVSWLGPNQPDINQPLNLPPYDPSVCPMGSSVPSLCNPAGSSSPRQARADLSSPAVGDGTAAPTSGSPEQTAAGVAEDLGGALDGADSTAQSPAPESAPAPSPPAGDGAANDLLNFLFGS